MPEVRVSMFPDQPLEVSDAEAEVLRRQGVLVGDPPPPPPASKTDDKSNEQGDDD